MFKRAILSTIFGGIIFFVWGYVSWMVLPFYGQATKKFTNETELAAEFAQNVSGDGVYMMPHCTSDHNTTAHLPVIFAAYQSKFDMSSPKPYICSGITQLCIALFTTLLLLMVRPFGYFLRLCFVTFTGFVIYFATMVPAMIWMGYSTQYGVTMIVMNTIGFFLAGLVIAGLINTKKCGSGCA